ESYPWKSNAHYWLVTNLYQNMRANALTDAELRRKAADELTCMTARINRGETIPEPVKQLPVMGGNTNHGIQISFTTKITGRGQQWLTRKLLDNGMLKVTGEAA
ncbi:replication protein P, partial [Escherichia coli]